MRRLFRAMIVLVVLGVAGLAVFAYLGDLSPEQRDMRVPVVLDAR